MVINKSAKKVLTKKNKDLPPKPTKEKTLKKTETSTNYYLCDFSKVRTFFIPEQKRSIKIKDTYYSFLENKKEKVLFVKESGNYAMFKASGLKPAGIRKTAWGKICKKN